MECAEDGCAQQARVRDYCQTHYNRRRLNGTLPPKPPGWRRKSTARPWTERLWSKIDNSENCWRFNGYHNPDGYAMYAHRQQHRSVLVHRTLYELFIGPVPDGMELDHLCKHRWCVNPWHLQPVTHQTNVDRGRGRRGQLKMRICPYGHDKLVTGRYRDGRCAECGRLNNAKWNARRRQSVGSR